MEETAPLGAPRCPASQRAICNERATTCRWAWVHRRPQVAPRGRRRGGEGHRCVIRSCSGFRETWGNASRVCCKGSVSLHPMEVRTNGDARGGSMASAYHPSRKPCGSQAIQSMLLSHTRGPDTLPRRRHIHPCKHPSLLPRDPDPGVLAGRHVFPANRAGERCLARPVSPPGRPCSPYPAHSAELPVDCPSLSGSLSPTTRAASSRSSR